MYCGLAIELYTTHLLYLHAYPARVTGSVGQQVSIILFRYHFLANNSATSDGFHPAIEEYFFCRIQYLVRRQQTTFRVDLWSYTRDVLKFSVVTVERVSILWVWRHSHRVSLKGATLHLPQGSPISSGTSEHDIWVTLYIHGLWASLYIQIKVVDSASIFLTQALMANVVLKRTGNEC